MGSRAVFLDRDGVLNDVPHLGWSPRQPGEVVILPGVVEALRRLEQAGWRAVVVSNQPGIAKGQMTEADHEAITGRIESELASAGAALAGCYYCLHHPDPAQVVDQRYLARCECRKPAPGLLRAAAAELGLELADCWMVGDAWRDIQAGVAAGCRTIAVGDRECWGGSSVFGVRCSVSGEPLPTPNTEHRTPNTVPEVIVNDLAEAVDYILTKASQ